MLRQKFWNRTQSRDWPPVGVDLLLTIKFCTDYPPTGKAEVMGGGLEKLCEGQSQNSCATAVKVLLGQAPTELHYHG